MSGLKVTGQGYFQTGIRSTSTRPPLETFSLPLLGRLHAAGMDEITPLCMSGCFVAGLVLGINGRTLE
jgi:hypothetical protein